MICAGKDTCTDRQFIEAICNATIADCMQKAPPTTVAPGVATLSPADQQKANDAILVNF